MRQSSAALLYGITVKAMDFCLVAASYEHVQPALLAIDLILARRARGRLEVESSVASDVSALPVEVWSLVKRELIDLTYDDLYDDLEKLWLPELFCDCCPHLVPQRRLGGRCADLFGSDGGLDELINAGGQAQKLLSDFGLQLAMDDLISMSDSAWTDLHSAWAVSLPLHLEKSPECEHSAAELEISHDMVVSQTLLTISPSTFVLPADADSRFRRLLSTFPVLEPVTFPTYPVRPPADRAKRFETELDPERKMEQQSVADRRERERAAAAQARRTASEPRWMRWSRGGSCS